MILVKMAVDEFTWEALLTEYLIKCLSAIYSTHKNKSLVERDDIQQIYKFSIFLSFEKSHTKLLNFVKTEFSFFSYHDL